MSMVEKICYNCFRKLEEEQERCPLCGYDLQSDAGKYPTALPYGSVLNGCYLIGRVLGQGGFGITYKAQEWKTKKIVAIKEYMPDTLANRTNGTMVSAYSDKRMESFEYGKKCFLDEARTLAEFIGNPNIVRVHSYFEENGTAYFVMDYIEGQSFQEYIEQWGGRIPWQEAEKILFPAIEALSAVHEKGIIHRDMTPDNIFITAENVVQLLDFGSARYSWGNQSQSLDIILKHGYAPIEQYSRHGRQGPYTDVYSVAACFYFSITGHIPPDAIDRPGDDRLIPPSSLGINIPVHMEDAILKGLSIYSADRFPNMRAFKAALQGEEDIRKSVPDFSSEGGGSREGQSESEKNSFRGRQSESENEQTRQDGKEASETGGTTAESSANQKKKLFLILAAAAAAILVGLIMVRKDRELLELKEAEKKTEVAKTKVSYDTQGVPENTVPVLTDSTEPKKPVKTAGTESKSVTRNTFGNLNNGGIAVEDNDYLYLALFGDGIEKRAKTDGAMKRLVEAADIKEINLYDEWLYYLTTNGVIYKVKTDGSEHGQVLENNVLTKFHIEDDYIYYCLAEEEQVYSLYRTPLAQPGTELSASQLLVSKMAEYYVIDQDWIYYWSMENGHFHRVKMNGTELTELSDISGWGAAIADDWIYVTDPAGIHRIKTDGSAQELVYEDTGIQGVNVQGDEIFFITGQYNGRPSLCRLKIGEEEVNILYSVENEMEFLADVNILGNYVLFSYFEEDGYMSVGIYDLKDETEENQEKMNEGGETWH